MDEIGSNIIADEDDEIRANLMSTQYSGFGSNTIADEDDEIRANLRSTQYPGFGTTSSTLLNPICTSCQIHPSNNPILNICIRCEYNRDIKSSCYSCTACVATRKYIADTDQFFTLCGYGSHYGQQTEVWECSRCRHRLVFALILPGMLRDTIHARSREVHSRNWCDKLRDGQLTLS